MASRDVGLVLVIGMAGRTASGGSHDTVMVRQMSGNSTCGRTTETAFRHGWRGRQSENGKRGGDNELLHNTLHLVAIVICLVSFVGGCDAHRRHLE